jgi:hypothetical protein
MYTIPSSASQQRTTKDHHDNVSPYYMLRSTLPRLKQATNANCPSIPSGLIQQITMDSRLLNDSHIGLIHSVRPNLMSLFRQEDMPSSRRIMIVICEWLISWKEYYRNTDLQDRKASTYKSRPRSPGPDRPRHPSIPNMPSSRSLVIVIPEWLISQTSVDPELQNGFPSPKCFLYR